MKRYVCLFYLYLHANLCKCLPIQNIMLSANVDAMITFIVAQYRKPGISCYFITFVTIF